MAKDMFRCVVSPRVGYATRCTSVLVHNETKWRPLLINESAPRRPCAHELTCEHKVSTDRYP